MNLNFYEKYVLLTINDEKGTIPFGYAKTYGFAGALLIEMTNKKLIDFVDKKIVPLKNNSDDEILNETLQILSSKKKPQKVHNALQLLSLKMHKHFDIVIEKLIKKGILALKEDKILWVFKVKHYPTQNPEPENQIKSVLRGIVLYGNHPDIENIQLLGLIDAIDLYKEIFSKEELKKARKKTKELIKSEEISDSVQKIIQQEIMMAVAISVATTTTVSSS